MAGTSSGQARGQAFGHDKTFSRRVCASELCHPRLRGGMTPPPRKARGTERRAALPLVHALRRGRVWRDAHAPRRSIAAALRARGRSFRGRTGSHRLAPIPQAFARVRPARVQPTKGRPHLVGADGCPWRPGIVRARHGRGRRARSPRNGATGSRPFEGSGALNISARARAGISYFSWRATRPQAASRSLIPASRPRLWLTNAYRPATGAIAARLLSQHLRNQSNRPRSKCN